MYQIEINSEGQIETIESDGAELLLSVLREAGYEIYAPCGGNGTCGKCKVWIQGEGAVTSCFYPVTQNLSIRLPDQRESQILVDQHQHTQKLPFNPGNCTDLSPYPYGVAIDIGTTTLVFYLVDLITGVISETRAIPNPQSIFGSDVISRINHTAIKENGLDELQQILLDSINDQFEHFINFIGISQDDIVKVTIAGNTTMLHLLLGKDPLSIALAPFTPKFIEAQILKTENLKLYCNQQAYIETLPCISAYVGADIVAGLASIVPSEKYQNYLFMDIGTNGELALVMPDKIICCATAAGPAFEGARITYGVMATDGAVSAYSEDGPSVIGSIPPVGICGSGLIDIVAYLVECGLVDTEGLLEKDFVVVPKKKTGIDEDIVINQSDIREVQLAKSAIAAGVTILLQKGGIAHRDIHAVFLAGGFGNYIDIENAMKIGLLSPQFSGKVISLGNTSGTGAFLALKSKQFSELADKIIDMSEHLELAEELDFTMEFAMNMMFDPHLIK